ncbi:HSP20 family protein [Natronocella acetinitrilica]|uniref:HSP20 family protein n=1 Tax=Natronocella acetinitrilica TaxID=414046 RepID=A0AAE3KA68_9GAMM|nr:Hsp20/alpha crystallin family protein [Natronocella acetinitrilica]MCP1673159.1 HSP20 family protein [Natronocella acetinitrilica]
MNIRRHEPWSLLNQLSSEMNTLFDHRQSPGTDASSMATSDWVPAVDIREENDRYLIHADIPGVDPEKIEISMENGVLSIRGERHHDSDETREGYRRVERIRGSFYRRFSLPDTADAERVSASSRNGVLEIVIPKQEKVQPRRITVQS